MKFKSLLLTCLGLCLSSVMAAQDLSVQANEKGKLGYANSQGVLVIPCQFDVATPFQDGVARVAKKDKWGIIDANGIEVVKCSYEDIATWGFGLFRVKVKGLYGVIDKAGTFIIPAEYSVISNTNSHGKAWLKKTGKKNAVTYGLANADGNVVIPATYGGLYEFSFDGSSSSIKMYHDGMFPQNDTRTAVTDTLKTDCEYVAVSGTSSFNYFGIIYQDGSVIMPLSNHWYVAKPQSGMVRWFDASGDQVTIGYYNIAAQMDMPIRTINQNFKDIKFWTHGDFYGDIAPINDAAGWYFINKSGEKVKSGYNNIAHNDKAGLWAARINGTPDHTELFDNDGNAKLADKTYERVAFSSYDEDYFYMAIQQDGKWGVADLDGTVFVPCTYDDARAPRFGIVYVKQNNKWGAIDMQNNELVPCNYINLRMNTKADPQALWVQDTDSLYHVYLIPEKQEVAEGYTAVTNFVDGFSWAHPKDLSVKAIQLNYAQVGLSIGSSSTTDFYKENKNFGYIVGEDGQVYFDQPLAYRHYETVKQELKPGHPLTPGRVYGILLKLTSGSRSYSINSTIGQDDWDF